MCTSRIYFYGINLRNPTSVNVQIFSSRCENPAITGAREENASYDLVAAISRWRDSRLDSSPAQPETTLGVDRRRSQLILRVSADLSQRYVNTKLPKQVSRGGRIARRASNSQSLLFFSFCVLPHFSRSIGALLHKLSRSFNQLVTCGPRRFHVATHSTSLPKFQRE